MCTSIYAYAASAMGMNELHSKASSGLCADGCDGLNNKTAAAHLHSLNSSGFTTRHVNLIYTALITAISELNLMS